MKGTENKLSLEKYLDFVISHKQTDLKVGFLRQVFIWTHDLHSHVKPS